jgi:hypothetical protein
VGGVAYTVWDDVGSKRGEGDRLETTAMYSTTVRTDHEIGKDEKSKREQATA